MRVIFIVTMMRVGISNLYYMVGLCDGLQYYLLANVSVYAVARPSVCRLYRSCALLRRFKFSAIFLRYYVPWLPLTSTENFTEVVPGEPLRRGS